LGFKQKRKESFSKLRYTIWNSEKNYSLRADICNLHIKEILDKALLHVLNRK
jgi:hypothetical protein